MATHRTAGREPHSSRDLLLGFTERLDTRAWRVALRVVLVLITAAATFLATQVIYPMVATADTAGSPTFDPATLPPAAAGFGAEVVGLLGDAHTAAQRASQGTSLAPSLPSVDQFQQSVTSMDSTGLAALYYVAQRTPNWDELPSLVQSVTAPTLSGSAGSSNSTGGNFVSSSSVRSVQRAASSASHHSLPAAGWSTVQGPTSFTEMLATPLTGNFTPSQPVAAAGFDACSYGSTVKYSTKFAIQLVKDILDYADEIFAVAVEGDPIAAAVVAIPRSILKDLSFFAQLTLDGLDLAWNDNGGCTVNDIHAITHNIDNTTFQSWGLLNSMQDTLGQLQASTDALGQGFDSLNTTSTDSASSATLQLADLQQQTTTLQTTVGTDTSTIMNLLSNVQSAIGGNSTSLQGAQGTIMDALDDSAAQISQLKSALATNTQQLGQQIDSNTQKVLDRVGNLSSQDTSQWQQQLKIEIEQALSAGSTAPVAQFELPASAGGYLDSTPVGVQEVVTDLLTALQQTGQSYMGQGVKSLNQANTELAAGQYKAAWSDYVSAYVSLAR